jgi:EAL domain-containing protein (putative c-di-GMP-specific phosphodiesterase class I)
MYLYAPTEILSQRLETVLRQNSLPFSIHQKMFAVNNRIDREKTLAVLQSYLSQPEAEDLRVTFDLENLMAATSLTQVSQRAETSWFEHALVNDRFVHWFQPIVNAREQTVFGHECLIRLAKVAEPGHFYNGEDIINAAISRGDLHVFDSYSRRGAILNAARQHVDGRVFVNFTPSSIYDPAFCMASTLQAMQDTHLRPEDIVFEVIECERVRDPLHLRKIVEYYREKGFAIALDDVGTGSNSLQMMSELQPDFIKLDKSLVWKCDSPVGLKTIQKLSELGAELGMTVIAEGIETEKMRDILLKCGISFMQGYFFGRPQPTMFVWDKANVEPAERQRGSVQSTVNAAAVAA